MPSLIEGIQYAGMVKPIEAESEYMLTDTEGVIDSFSKGVTAMLNITPNLFKDKDSSINIQLIAPELIQFFLDTTRRGGRPAKSKYRDPGGEKLELIIPKDFHSIIKSDSKTTSRSAGGRSKTSKGHQSSVKRSQVFRKFIRFLQKPSKFTKEQIPTTQQILNLHEYKNPERKKDVTCEIECVEVATNSNEIVRILVFKFTQVNATKEKDGGQ